MGDWCRAPVISVQFLQPVHALTVATHRSFSKANQIHQVCLQPQLVTLRQIRFVAGVPLLAAPDLNPGIAHSVSSDCRTCYRYQFNLLILQQHALLQFVGYFLTVWKHLVESRHLAMVGAMVAEKWRNLFFFDQ